MWVHVFDYCFYKHLGNSTSVAVEGGEIKMQDERSHEQEINIKCFKGPDASEFYETSCDY